MSSRRRCCPMWRRRCAGFTGPMCRATAACARSGGCRVWRSRWAARRSRRAARSGRWRGCRCSAAAQPRAWAMARQRGGQAAVAVVLLLARRPRWPLWGSGLIAGFAMLGALLIGGALALPPLLARALRLAEDRARGPVAQWFWADTRQQVPGLSLALMALLLAMAANVGVSTMVSSFPADLHRLSGSAPGIRALRQRRRRRTGRGDHRCRRARRGCHPAAPVGGSRRSQACPRRSMARAITPPIATTGSSCAPCPMSGTRLARAEGVLINEQLSRRAGLDLGAMVPVGAGCQPAGAGDLWRLWQSRSGRSS